LHGQAEQYRALEQHGLAQSGIQYKLAGYRLLQTVNDPQQRGLATAVGPYQRHPLTGLDVETHALQRQRRTVARGERYRYLVQTDQA
jgi:hypothetical protein